MTTLENRWSLIGHVMSRDIDIPGKKIYGGLLCAKSEKKFEEGPEQKMPKVVNKDLILIPAGKLEFKTKNDLDRVRSRADHRTQWRRKHPRGSRGVQVGALGCERRYRFR